MRAETLYDIWPSIVWALLLFHIHIRALGNWKYFAQFPGWKVNTTASTTIAQEKCTKQDACANRGGHTRTTMNTCRSPTLLIRAAREWQVEMFVLMVELANIYKYILVNIHKYAHMSVLPSAAVERPQKTWFWTCNEAHETHSAQQAKRLLNGTKQLDGERDEERERGGLTYTCATDIGRKHRNIPKQQ